MRYAIALCAVLVSTSLAGAQAHYRDIVALRWWGGEAASIETFWGLNIGIGERVREDVPGVNAVFPSRDIEASAVTVDRFPNSEEIQVHDARLRIARTDNAVHLEMIEHGRDAMLLARAHGVRILFASPVEDKITPEDLGGSLDALMLMLDNDENDFVKADRMLRSLRPSMIVLVGHQPMVERIVKSVPPIYQVDRLPGNTVAVAKPDPLESRVPRVVVLQDSPWEPRGELAELIDAMEASSRNAGEAFAPLTVEQLNHLPSDGTHRPRWNVEHMAGQEITLFLDVFARFDSAFRREDPRPTNKPAEYEPKHPEWTAAEEVREIERTQEFVRRFAYLLKDVDLDERPESGGWTLRTILERMAWHWGHHTGKLGSKMALPDWPKGE